MPEKFLRLGNRFTIRMGGNPTTGYSWEATVSDPRVIYLTGEYVAANSDTGMVGTPGTFVFSGIAKGRGSSTITLEYKRPWEDTPIEVKTYNVRVI